MASARRFLLKLMTRFIGLDLDTVEFESDDASKGKRGRGANS